MSRRGWMRLLDRCDPDDLVYRVLVLSVDL